MTDPDPAHPAIFPARPSRFVRPGFLWYAARLFRKRFNALRLTPDSEDSIREAAERDAPLLVVSNHPGWWDPLVLFLIGDRYFPDRPTSGPIDAAQWRKFSALKRVGLFGLDTEHPDAFDALVAHCTRLCAHSPRTAFGITAQGAFTDVRAPVRLRPGAAALASALPNPSVLAVNLEYAFWNEPKPEAFLHARGVQPPDSASTTSWQRALTRTLRHGSETLSGLVIAREPDAFRLFSQRRGGRAHASGVTPLHDLWMRLRGHDPRMPTGTDRRQPLSGDAAR
ncbi:MAG: hypothetical protein ACF8Q5_13600 [Phycisphaerales bacterium JB040]